MATTIQGMDELLKKLVDLKEHTGRKAARSGLVAGLGVAKDAIRAGINNSDAPPLVKAEARKTIGKRLAKASEAAGRVGGKVGFGVAQKSKKIKASAQKHYASGQTGVGISAANVHWFVLGTVEQRKFKHPHTGVLPGGDVNVHWRWVTQSGKIKPWLAGITKQSMQATMPEIMVAMQDKITQVIAADAAKK